MDDADRYHLQREAVLLFGAIRVAELANVGGGYERLTRHFCVIPGDGWEALEKAAREIGKTALADRFGIAGEPDYN